VRRLRLQLRTAWVAVAAVAIVWLLRALFGRNPQEEIAHPHVVSSAESPEAPPSSAPGQATTPQQSTRELRERAFKECDAKQWEPCLKDLQSASTDDPAGDSDPKVRRAYDEAMKHVPSDPRP
jgi:hypothetical protein